MKKAWLYRTPALLLVLVALAGCKLMDDTVEEEATWSTSAGTGARGNSAPFIWGDPVTDVPVNTQYRFTPEAEDADGDVLKYHVVNKPAWAEFNVYSGSLQGVPDADDAGTYRHIVISVTDGNSIVSLPSFAVDVQGPEGGSGTDDGTSDSDGGDDTGGSGDDGSDGEPPSSSPPTISGTPNEAVVVDNLYSFQPDASDPDGDDLSFSIVNRPAWASFDTTTGLLEGRPGQADVGTTDSIGISVTDGTSIAALADFTVTVEPVPTASYTVSWIPPTENEDGTHLTDLAGYRIYYGTSPGKYSETIEVASAGLTSYVIDDLTPGTYYLAMTSVNSQEIESQKTPELEFHP